MGKILELSEELFIGKGGHQATYIHPGDPSLCVKIPHDPKDVDVKKELRYRRICEEQLTSSILVTKYYGTTDTSRGKGYVFERVLDGDGNTSRDLKDFLPAAEENVTPDKVALIRELLLRFKEDYLRERIVMADTDITNFMVQHLPSGEYRIRIVDNIGTPVWIPLVYYFEFFSVRRAKRYWDFIASYLWEHYPDLISTDFFKELAINKF